MIGAVWGNIHSPSGDDRQEEMNNKVADSNNQNINSTENTLNLNNNDNCSDVACNNLIEKFDKDNHLIKNNYISVTDKVITEWDIRKLVGNPLHTIVSPCGKFAIRCSRIDETKNPKNNRITKWVKIEWLMAGNEGRIDTATINTNQTKYEKVKTKPKNTKKKDKPKPLAVGTKKKTKDAFDLD